MPASRSASTDSIRDTSICPEMQHYSGASQPPFFVPSVDHTWCGMLVSMPLPPGTLAGPSSAETCSKSGARATRRSPSCGGLSPEDADLALRDGKFLDLDTCNLTNRLELMAFGGASRGLVLVGRLDNLGKGASGNAVQCMNLMLGFDEQSGLRA